MSKLLSSLWIKSGFCPLLRNGFKINNRLIKCNNCCQRLRLFSNQSLDNQNLNESNIDLEFKELINDKKYEELVPHQWRPISDKERVLLVMPRQKWGHKQMIRSYAKHVIDETIALVNSLPQMEVIDVVMISTLEIGSKNLFGSGNLELLKSKVIALPTLTGVVFSIDRLNAYQTQQMETHLGLDIYDRYSIVLNIFRSQAKTRESKLQICLAEIPYIRSNLKILEKTGHSKRQDLLNQFGGSGEAWIETRRRLLNERELKLKKLLKKLQLNRELLRNNRQRKQIPTVAVVGYTNSGKTSLIKALTNDEKLIPRNHLFATLDVTVHMGRLPSNLNVLYTDTVGFISEMPTALIHSFKATLREICLADLIVHVLDVSHPNHLLQQQTVHKTLDDIGVPEHLKASMIEIGNKIDLLEDKQVLENSDKLLISVTERTGLDLLISKIEKSVIENTKRLEKTLRVANGGPQYQWFCKESAINECNVDPNDANFLIIKIYITFEALQKFKNYFKDSYCEIE